MIQLSQLERRRLPKGDAATVICGRQGIVKHYWI